MIFTRDFVTRENYWQIASLVTQKSLFTVTHALFFISSLCRLIWRHWTNKMLVRYMLPSVCLRLRLFSQLSFIQYKGLCVFSLPNSPVMIVRMCTLPYHHHQIGSMNRWPLFRVRSWNNGMRCMSNYVLMVGLILAYLCLPHSINGFRLVVWWSKLRQHSWSLFFLKWFNFNPSMRQ